MIELIRHAMRRLLRARAFTVTAILTLTLGIGGATAVFTVVNGVLLRPLPYERSEQLVDLSHTLVVSGLAHVDQSDATYLVYRRENRAFTDVGAYRATAVNLGSLSGSAASSPQRVPATFATAGVFGVLAASPARGRLLTEGDGRPGAPLVVVIGHRLWERTFGSDAAIVGKRVIIDGAERTIVGVTREEFHFPSFETALWLPLPIDPLKTASAAFDFRGIARLKPGVSIASASADLKRLLPQVPAMFPGRLTLAAINNIKMQPEIRPLRDVVVGDVGRVLWVVLGAVGVVWLVACANVANLFLARAEGRQLDLAVRRALGARRGRLLAEHLAEAVIVASIGGVLGLACATGGVRLLQVMGAAASIPRLADVNVDALVVAVTVCTVALAAIVVSAMPVFRSGRASLSETLMAQGRAGVGRARHRVRRALIVAQVAAALVLLTAAGLLARSFARLRAVDPGFSATSVLSARMTFPTAAYPTSDVAARGILRSLDAVATLPGVLAAGVATKLPLDATARQDSAVWVLDRLPAPGSIPNLHSIVFATPGYFGAMGIPVVSGRLFATPDPSGAPSSGPPEVIVSEAFARRYWTDESPIGKRLRMFPADPWSTIVGVVGSVRDAALEQPPTEMVYAPLVTLNAARAPWTPRDVAIVVRTAGDATRLVGAVQGAVHDVDPALPLYRVMPASALLAGAAARTTLTLLMLAVAAFVALAIGAVGIYGVISYLVSLRTRDIGVRLALGATAADVQRLVTRQALTDATIGVALGVGGAIAVTRVLSAIVFEVSPTDPGTLVGASVVLLVTAVLASWLPARRAAAVDPVIALRSQ